jgi:hypothetical protein
MSDSSISIVPKTSTYPNREHRAKEILKWLVSLNLVNPLTSDCVLGAKGGYSISSGAINITTEPDLLPFDYSVNGLEIITDRQVFHANELEQLICPSCGKDISKEDWDFFNEWSEGLTNDLTCPYCKTPSEIHQYKFNPQWAFSDLGFRFWNWPPFSKTFIIAFQQKLECDVDIIYTRI